jgi:carbamoyl-phosphate synthase large subunit
MDATGMLAADIAVVVPPANDPSFRDAVVDVCRTHGPALLFSLHDWEAPYLAAMSDELKMLGVLPVMPTLDVIRLCLDKHATGRRAADWGIRAPISFLSVADAMNGLTKGEVSYPLVVKPRWGQGSVGLFQVRDENELDHAFHLCQAKARESRLSAGAWTDADRQVIVQQWVSGHEYGVDIVNDLEGRFVKAFVKRKLAMRSGETDGAETVSYPAIECCAERIARATKHLGNMDADFMVDLNNDVYLLELNPRFGGGYPFSHVAGVHLPRTLLAWAQQQDINPAWLSLRLGVCSYKDMCMRLA